MIIFNDNFEIGDFGLWTLYNGATIDNSGEIDGVYCAKLDADAEYVWQGFIAPISEIFLQFKMKAINATGAYGNIVSFRNGSTTLGSLYAVGTGSMPIKFKLEAWKGSVPMGTDVGLYDTFLDAEVEYAIKIRYLPHATAGEFQVWVDGDLVIDFSGSTAPSTQDIAILRFGSINTDSMYFFFDSVVVDDAGWPVDAYVHVTGGGFELGSDSEVLPQNRPSYVVGEALVGEEVASFGGFLFGGENEPTFSIPVAITMTSMGGFAFGGDSFPEFLTPSSVTIKTHGGVKFGGKNRPIFIAPGETEEGEAALYTHRVRGGFSLRGSQRPKFVTPGIYRHTVSGGFKLSGPFSAAIKFVREASSDLSTSLTSRGGFEFGGENFPVFTAPPVFPVFIDPRIKAAMCLGGEGGATFIRPHIYEAEAGGELQLASEYELVQDDAYETWVLDGKEFEPSFFTGWRFNSFAFYRGEPLGASEDGLYVLRGIDDDGEPIVSGVRIGPINFASDGDKRMRSINFGDGNPGIEVRVQAGDRERILYADREPNRVTVTRDLRGSEFIIDFAKFTKLHHLEIVPLTLIRR